MVLQRSSIIARRLCSASGESNAMLLLLLLKAFIVISVSIYCMRREKCVVSELYRQK